MDPPPPGAEDDYPVAFSSASVPKKSEDLSDKVDVEPMNIDSDFSDHSNEDLVKNPFTDKTYTIDFDKLLKGDTYTDFMKLIAEEEYKLQTEDDFEVRKEIKLKIKKLKRQRKRRVMQENKLKAEQELAKNLNSNAELLGVNNQGMLSFPQASAIPPYGTYYGGAPGMGPGGAPVMGPGVTPGMGPGGAAPVMGPGMPPIYSAPLNSMASTWAWQQQAQLSVAKQVATKYPSIDSEYAAWQQQVNFMKQPTVPNTNTDRINRWDTGPNQPPNNKAHQLSVTRKLALAIAKINSKQAQAAKNQPSRWDEGPKEASNAVVDSRHMQVKNLANANNKHSCRSRFKQFQQKSPEPLYKVEWRDKYSKGENAEKTKKEETKAFSPEERNRGQRVSPNRNKRMRYRSRSKTPTRKSGRNPRISRTSPIISRQHQSRSASRSPPRRSDRSYDLEKSRISRNSPFSDRRRDYRSLSRSPNRFNRDPKIFRTGPNRDRDNRSTSWSPLRSGYDRRSVSLDRHPRYLSRSRSPARNRNLDREDHSGYRSPRSLSRSASPEVTIVSWKRASPGANTIQKRSSSRSRSPQRKKGDRGSSPGRLTKNFKEDTLKVLIVSNREAGQVTEEEAAGLRRYLIQQMVKAMAGTANKPGPELKFKESSLIDEGWFMITAEDEASAQWLINSLPPVYEGNLVFKTVPASCASWPERIGFCINAPKVDLTEVMTMLSLQNRALKLEKWKHINTSGSPGNWRLTFLVNKGIVGALDQAGWILYYELVTLAVTRETSAVFGEPGPSKVYPGTAREDPKRLREPNPIGYDQITDRRKFDRDSRSVDREIERESVTYEGSSPERDRDVYDKSDRGYASNKFMGGSREKFGRGTFDRETDRSKIEEKRRLRESSPERYDEEFDRQTKRAYSPKRFNRGNIRKPVRGKFNRGTGRPMIQEPKNSRERSPEEYDLGGDEKPSRGFGSKRFNRGNIRKPRGRGIFKRGTNRSRGSGFRYV